MRSDRPANTSLRLTNRLARVTVIVLGLGTLVLAGVMTYFQATAVRQSAEVQAHRTAHVVATQFSWMFQASAQALQRIEELAVLTPALSTVPSDITEAVRDLPDGLQHSLYDAAGLLILTSVPNPGQIDVSDRSYFQEAKAGRELVVSPMVTERLTGEKVFIIARRIDRNNEFAGVATIAIPLTTLDELAKDLDIPAGSTISLIHDNGMLIARSPPAEPIDLKDSELFQLLPAMRSGTYAAVSPVDGSRRIVGFWQMADWEVIAVAGLNEERVFSPFRKRLVAELAVIGPLVLALCAMLFWVFRMQSRDETREAKLVAVNRRNDHLLREIHHRVKNNLQTVTSLIRLEDISPQIKSGLLGRISAMAAAHQEMYSAEDLDTVAVAPFLTRIVSSVASGYGTKVEVELDIAELSLRGERALQLGLVVNELVSNAFKHAFAGREDGKLKVSLRPSSENTLLLSVSDNGPGTFGPNGQPTLGTRLVSAFVTQLDGTMRTVSSQGLRIEIEFPVKGQDETARTAGEV